MHAYGMGSLHDLEGTMNAERQWRAQASGGAGAKWRYEGTIADPGGGVRGG